jgi:hypothetical protein
LTWPAFGRSIPMMHVITVDLPDPLGAIRLRRSPAVVVPEGVNADQPGCAEALSTLSATAHRCVGAGWSRDLSRLHHKSRRHHDDWAHYNDIRPVPPARITGRSTAAASS